MDTHKDFYTSEVSLSISFFTWNLEGHNPEAGDLHDLEDLLFEGEHRSDMFVISLQEMIPLKTSNVVYKKKDR
jgi:hypothetical protein